MIQKNDVVCITGATDGLGRSLTIQLSQLGMNLILCGRSQEKMNSLLKELNPNIKIAYECFDLTDFDRINPFISKAVSQVGEIDCLINNAGANLKKDLIVNIDEENFDMMMKLNCYAPLKMIQSVAPSMKERKKGNIVNILSSVCLHNMETMASYTASKQAFNAIHKILQKELREDHISVLGVYPGGIDTNFRTVERPDYLSADTVARLIITNITQENEASVQELVLRPFVESNY